MAVNVFPAAGGGGAGGLDRNYKATSAGTYTVDIPNGIYYANSYDILGPVTIGSTMYNLGYSTGSLTYPGATLILPDDVTSVTFSSGIAYRWSAASSAVTQNRLAVAYGNNLFVIGHADGYLTTSTDGITWVSRTSNIAGNLHAITYGLGLYVVCSQAGAITTSTDGITWTSRTSNTTTIRAIAASPTRIAVGGEVGVLRTSDDGVTWTTRTSNTTVNINSMAYGAGVFVSVGNSGNIRSSTDGITWTTRTSGVTNLNLWRIRFSNNIFLVGGDNNYFRTSTDGITWTSRTAPGDYAAVEYINGYYWATIQNDGVRASTDLITWETRPGVATPSTGGEPSVAIGNGVMVAVDTNNISYSPPAFGTQYLKLEGQGEITNLV